MKTLFRTMLETTLFKGDVPNKIVLVPTAEDVGAESESPRRGSESFEIPDDCFPAQCRICRLPGGEDFLSSAAETLPTDSPIRAFVLPPPLRRDLLSDKLRAEYPGMDLACIVLTRLAEAVAPGSQLWVMLPESFLSNESSRATRERVFRVASPRLIVTHDHSMTVFRFGFRLHAQFRMVSLLLETGGPTDAPIRFFKCPAVENDAERAEVVADFRRLLQQGGGNTKHGYVVREMPPSASWHYAANHPDLARRQEDLAHLGGIRRLSDLVEPVRAINLTMDARLLSDVAGDAGVIVVEGRDITNEGTIECDEPRHRAVVPVERQLRPGDICVRSIQGRLDRLVCAEVEDGMQAATVAQSVIALRPRADATALSRYFLLAFLRSSACAEFLRASGIGIQINLNRLLALQVPVGDEALHLAVEGLGNAARQFRGWAEELEAARGSLFDSSSSRKARGSVLSMGRLAKQRYEAASLVSDFGQRARTRFPYPIAFRWRSVESQHPNLEGYSHVLECAEVAVTYLAIMALLLAKAAGKRVGSLSQMANRISTTGHGTNMGDWLNIIQEVGGSAFTDGMSDTAPFVEVTRFQNEKQIKDCLRSLTDRRNDLAHTRGPKGSAVEAAFRESKQQLETLLQGIEFLSDYPLRYVEETRRDTLRKITCYGYRELMGDHALVPITHGETPDAEIEAKSLYLYDRSGQLHLLRPLLIGRECPVCHSWGSFFLDTLAKSKQQEKIVLKSMEHGHTCDDMDLVAAFKHWGMIQ